MRVGSVGWSSTKSLTSGSAICPSQHQYSVPNGAPSAHKPTLYTERPCRNNALWLASLREQTGKPKGLSCRFDYHGNPPRRLRLAYLLAKVQSQCDTFFGGDGVLNHPLYHGLASQLVVAIPASFEECAQKSPGIAPGLCSFRLRNQFTQRIHTEVESRSLAGSCMAVPTSHLCRSKIVNHWPIRIRRRSRLQNSRLEQSMLSPPAAPFLLAPHMPRRM